MKLFLLSTAALLSFATAALAEPVTADLGNGKTLSFETELKVEVNSQEQTIGEVTTLAMDDPKEGTKMRVGIFPAPPSPMPLEEIKKRTKAEAEKLLEFSEEEAIEMKDLDGGDFQLAYYELTDNREDAGDGRYMAHGVGRSEDFLMQFQILTDVEDSATKAAMLKSLSTLKITEKE